MAMLQLQNIDMVFNPGTVNEAAIFRGFELGIEKGQFVSVVGSNGSGKTTLLNLICGNLNPTKGDIVLEGKSILKMAEHPAGPVYRTGIPGSGEGNQPLHDNFGKHGLGRQQGESL